MKNKEGKKKLIIYQTWTLITPNTTHHNISKHIHMHKMLILALVNLTRKLKICRFSSYLTRNYEISQISSYLTRNPEISQISSRATRKHQNGRFSSYTIFDMLEEQITKYVFQKCNSHAHAWVWPSDLVNIKLDESCS